MLNVKKVVGRYNWIELLGINRDYGGLWQIPTPFLEWRLKILNFKWAKGGTEGKTLLQGGKTVDRTPEPPKN